MDSESTRRIIKRRPPEETKRELNATRDLDELPGGAEGGEPDPEDDRLGALALPKKDGAALGDTDQHSSPERVPGKPER